LHQPAQTLDDQRARQAAAASRGRDRDAQELGLLEASAEGGIAFYPLWALRPGRDQQEGRGVGQLAAQELRRPRIGKGRTLDLDERIEVARFGGAQVRSDGGQDTLAVRWPARSVGEASAGSRPVALNRSLG